MSATREKIVDTTDKTVSREEAVIAQAKKRARDTLSFNSRNFSEGKDDLRMLAGLNHWPDAIKRKREIDGRPVLTINKLPTFTDQIINDSMMNTISIKVKPNGGGATKGTANIFNGLIRNIENVSNADIAYQTAMDGAVYNGFGYFRVMTSFIDETSFDQEILIKRIKNPMTVLLDPSHLEFDSRDIRFAIITETVSREEYEIRYPGKTIMPFESTDHTDFYWSEEDKVRIAEYWVKEPIRKKIYLLSDGRTVEAEDWDKIVDDLKANEKSIHIMPNPQNPQGPPVQMQGPAPEGSGFPEKVVNPTPTVVREKTIDTHKVVQYLIDGHQIIEGPTEWLGKFIPIIPIWGKEFIVDEERHLRGAIRFAKDPQRIYNYFRTAATETVALAPKAPYMVEEKQIEGHEAEWADANTKNLPYLKYKHVKNVPPPSRQIVTQTAVGEITEANISTDEMKATTSLYDSSLGAQGNETSGVAIMSRKRQGDTANFVFHRNKEIALKYTGDILVDLIPKVYDTERQLTIINDTEDEEFVMVNQVVKDRATLEDVVINDLTMGRYKVVTDVGPSMATQREESANSMMDFIRTAPETASVVMDLIAEAQNWPGSTKIANRIRKMLLPPGIDEKGPPPPKQPDIDEVLKQSKLKSSNLGNIKKKLDIVEKKRELEVAGSDEVLKGMGINIGGEGNG